MSIAYILITKNSIDISSSSGLWAGFVMGISILTSSHFWVIALKNNRNFSLDPFCVGDFAGAVQNLAGDYMRRISKLPGSPSSSTRRLKVSPMVDNEPCDKC